MYLKMDSLQSAQGAYKALHGGWYRGEQTVHHISVVNTGIPIFLKSADSG